MKLHDWLFYKKQGLKQRLGAKLHSPTAAFRVPPGKTNKDFRERAPSPLGDLFFDRTGRQVTKWVDYLNLYDRHFSKFRGTPVRLLEIGVLNGGSLEIWREYFGPSAQIVGVDIDPNCADRVNAPNKVRIGSQDDPAFLKSVVDEMGGVDIVIDDGSHIGRHQIASFKALFPHLSDGGIYCIEDLHTSYWPGEWEGGYQRAGTGIEMVKQLIDDIHGWFHEKGDQFGVKQAVTAIHTYESIVFIDKGGKGHPIALE